MGYSGTGHCRIRYKVLEDLEMVFNDGVDRMTRSSAGKVGPCWIVLKKKFPILLPYLSSPIKKNYKAQLTPLAFPAI